MRGAILILPLVAIGGCAGDDCANTLVARHVDPGGKFVAYVFVRDCGATTDYATSLAIGRSDAPQSDAVIAFTADAAHGAARTDGKAIWLRANWTAPGKLSVVYAEHSRTYRKDTSVAGVQISYRESAPFEAPRVLVREPKSSRDVDLP